MRLRRRFVYLAAALEGIAYGLLEGSMNISLIAHLGLSLHTLNKFSHPEIKKLYLDKIINQNHKIAFSVSEPHGGSSPQKIETVLIPTQNGYLLKGKKWLATNGPNADLIITIAQEDKTMAPTCVLMEAGWKGIEKKDISLLGLGNSTVAQFTFHDVFIPEKYVLGKMGEGLDIMNEAFVRERFLVPFGCIGLCERILDTLLEYTQERVIGKHPIAEYQYIKKRLTDIAIRLETMRAISHMGLKIFKEKNNMNLCASVCKHYSTRQMIDVCIDAIQTMGSYGLLENSVGKMLYTAMASTIAGGTEETHREEIFIAIYRRYRKNKRSMKHE